MEINENKSLSSNDAQILEYIKALLHCRKFTESEEEKLQKIREMLENGELSQAITKSIVSEAKTLKQKNTEEDIYWIIINNIPAIYFDGRKAINRDSGSKKQVILSCYLRR